jgi:hypothetical protein
VVAVRGCPENRATTARQLGTRIEVVRSDEPNPTHTYRTRPASKAVTRGSLTHVSRAMLPYVFALMFAGTAIQAQAAEWFVARGAVGVGTSASPFGRIQHALDAAKPGDMVTIRGGTYAERIATVRSGSGAAPIVVRAAGTRGSVVITTPGRVLTVNHAYIVAERLVLDGQYGADDIVRVSSAAHSFELRDSEVRRSTRDLVDIGAAQNVLIDNSLLHRALNAADGRTDAHGVVAGAVRNLTIRNTEIHTFSGDAVQVDPGRSAPGWSGVLIEGCYFWLAPLVAAENGFAAGTVPGENGVDTKAAASLPRARITIRNNRLRISRRLDLQYGRLQSEGEHRRDCRRRHRAQLGNRVSIARARHGGVGYGEKRGRLRRGDRIPLRGPR